MNQFMDDGAKKWLFSVYNPKFLACKRNAFDTGIDFLLTFDEWIQIWLDSGKLEQRGLKKGQWLVLTTLVLTQKTMLR